MTAALRTDDAAAFRQAFADCADDCDRATWVSEAVRKTAPRSLAVTLEGVRHASAAAGAAIASVGWLANAGVTLHTANEVDEVWYRFAKWTDANPPEIARKGAEAWLVESAKIPMDGAAAQNRIAPLERAVYVDTQVFVQVLLQHGYRVDDPAPEYRARFDAMQDPIRHPLTPVPDTVCDDDAN